MVIFNSYVSLPEGIPPPSQRPSVIPGRLLQRRHRVVRLRGFAEGPGRRQWHHEGSAKGTAKEGQGHQDLRRGSQDEIVGWWWLIVMLMINDGGWWWLMMIDNGNDDG